MMDGGKIIIAGNPHEVKGHWWNQFCAKMRFSPDYEFIDATCFDIWKVLPEEMKKEINNEFKYNPAMARFMLSSAVDGCYLMRGEEDKIDSSTGCLWARPRNGTWYRFSFFF